MRDGWLTTAQLLASTQIPGKRPDAVLKRLRREGILARPRLGKGRGRGRGVTWWYPPGSDRRVARVVELRRNGVRAFRELRWRLWFEGHADMWDRLQADLLAAYPPGLRAALAELSPLHANVVDEAIAVAAPHLARRWGSRPLPTGESTAWVSPEEREMLAQVAISAAIPSHALPLDAPFDDVAGETAREKVEAAWGAGSAAAHDQLVSSGGSDAAQWEDALKTAPAADAARAAAFLRRTFNPQLLRSNLRLFSDEWGDRALLVAGLLHSLRSIHDVDTT